MIFLIDHSTGQCSEKIRSSLPPLILWRGFLLEIGRRMLCLSAKKAEFVWKSYMNWELALFPVPFFLLLNISEFFFLKAFLSWRLRKEKKFLKANSFLFLMNRRKRAI